MLIHHNTRMLSAPTLPFCPKFPFPLCLVHSLHTFIDMTYIFANFQEDFNCSLLEYN